MHVAPFPAADAPAIARAAALLHEAFPHADGWPSVDDAADEVRAALADDRVCLAAIDPTGEVQGWIGALPTYDGRVWELHPLVVAPGARGRGVGRALVEALVAAVATRGALTVWLGADDVDGATSLGGVELWPDPLAHLRAVTADRRHPLGFYRKLGFRPCGVVPDANGRGKPDLLLARSVR